MLSSPRARCCREASRPADGANIGVADDVRRDDAAGIVALRNHATAILDALDLAERIVDGNQPLGEQHAVRVALRCALAKVEEVK